MLSTISTTYIWASLEGTWVAMTNDKLQECLRDLINRWLEAKETRNISFLSHRTQLSQQKLYRLNRGDKVDLDLIELMKLLNVVADTKISREIYQEFFPDELKVALGTLQDISEKSEKTEFDDLYFQYLSKDPAYYTALALCWLPEGASLGQIAEMIGPKAKLLIEELCNVELIEELSSGKYRIKQDATRISTDRDMALACTIRGAQALKTSSQKFMAFTYCNGISRSALVQISDIVLRAKKEMSDVLLNEKNYGDIPFVINFSAGDLVSKSK